MIHKEKKGRLVRRGAKNQRKHKGMAGTMTHRNFFFHDVIENKSERKEKKMADKKEKNK